LLVQRGVELQKAVRLFADVDLYIHKSPWHHILWDPVSGTMIHSKVALAETQLLRLAGQAARTKLAEKRLSELLRNVS
jgi:hypothetical protein